MINMNGTSETKYYYHFDGLGSVVALTDSSGGKVETYNYDVVGTAVIRNSDGTVISVSSVANRFMFTGREWDSESGNYYYRARCYKASIGKFLQVDPVRYSDATNTYFYCSNNPINLIDPSGMSWWSFLPIIGTVGSCFGTPNGSNFGDYNSCFSSGTCHLTKSGAIAECILCVSEKEGKFMALEIGNGLFRGIVDGIVGTYAPPPANIIAVIDGVADFVCTNKNLGKISEGAGDASRRCKQL